ncbi:MAG TPA: hypothetical protein PKA90_13820 [Ignavibacteria bacterium]|nr:hypothetical protein [Ignavibacteria bacterium]HMR41497.1 hypothetical protein [Ignavibacteria bacterium]
MGYKVVRVSTGNQLKDFIDLPFGIYRNDDNWVAPLRSELKRTIDSARNPYFREPSIELFNCYDGDNIVSRISVSVNDEYCRKAGVRTGFFGFFESFNNSAAVKFLFDEIIIHCRENGIERLEGPFNPNLYSELALLSTDYNSPPSFFQTYNPEYYHSLLKDNGFSVLQILHTRINKDSRGYFNEKFSKPLDLESDDIRVRSFRKNYTKQDLEHLRNIYNDAFSENWHFTPVSKEEYMFASKHLKLVTPPDLIRFVEYKGEPVAAVHFALDINPLLKRFKGRAGIMNYLRFLNERKKIDRATLFAVGAKKEFQNSRIIRLLFNATVEVARRFEILETTWMYDENRIVISLAEKLGLKRDKEFLVYYRDVAV